MSLSNFIVRNPNVVLYISVCSPLKYTLDTAVYRCGCSVSHSAGFFTVQFCSNRRVDIISFDELTEDTHLPEGSYISVISFIFPFFSVNAFYVWFFIDTDPFFVEISGVQMNVPQWATCIGEVHINLTGR